MTRAEMRVVLVGFVWRALLIMGVLYGASCTNDTPEPSAPSGSPSWVCSFVGFTAWVFLAGMWRRRRWWSP